MKHNQSSEDYLETILLLSRELEDVHRVDVARRMGVSQPAVQKAIKILQAGEYLEFDGMHIYLTQKGAEYAEKIYSRHCKLREFLLLLGVGEENANTDACEMEHFISEETFQAIKAFVDKR